MNPLPKTCVTAALVALLPLGAATAQAQRNPSEGSSLYSPASADTPKAPAKADATKSGNRNSKAATKAAPAAAAASRGSIAVAALAGRWQDAACVPLSSNGAGRPLFVQRAYRFDEKEKSWTMSANVYSSDRCVADTRMMTYEGSGSYEITGRSRVGTNVYEATFTMSNWQATATSREGTLAMFNARCGSGVFDEGRIIDLTRSGCSLVTLQPLTVAATGRELLRVTDDKIFLGANSPMPHQGSERPTQLSSYGLSKL